MFGGSEEDIIDNSNGFMFLGILIFESSFGGVEVEFKMKAFYREKFEDN